MQDGDLTKNVLTACKAVTLLGGQQIIAVNFYHKVKYILEARSKRAEKIIQLLKKIMSYASLFFSHVVFALNCY